MKIFQIYFDESQAANLEPTYTPVFNVDCTVFFENEVIRGLIESKLHIGHDYFGVVSYKLKQKLAYIKDNWKNNKNIANQSTTEFTPELFEKELYKHTPDVMSFQRHMPHDPISVATKFHPRFMEFWQRIIMEIGYDWKPEIYQDPIYCNYFVARSEIYEEFVKDMLIPAMDFMKTMPALYENSHYPHPLPENLHSKFNVQHWPYHPFICERMFTFFVHIRKLKCLHY